MAALARGVSHLTGHLGGALTAARSGSSAAGGLRATLLPGDGVGPEAADAAVGVASAADVPLQWDRFDSPIASELDVIASISRNGVALKGTLFSPTYLPTAPDSAAAPHMSINVRLRRSLDMFANVVPCKNLPGVPSRHTGVDLVVIRENSEGEYTGFEQMLTPGVVQSIKMITRKASLRTARFAFQYAADHGRRKVTAVHKANIQKLTDGEFLKACRDVAKDYAGIEYGEMIVDNTTMQLAMNPRQFDVMVTPNLYGNIVTNVAAGLVGGPGIIAGVNLSTSGDAVFEPGARHVGRSLAGKNLCNPTAMLLASTMLMQHLGLQAHASRIETAVLAVLEEGRVRTRDLGGSATTKEFTQAVIARLDAAGPR